MEGRTSARERDYSFTRTLAVSPGFFSTFGVRMLEGRPILASDGVESGPVAVVSQEFARRYSPKLDPVGQRIRLGGPESKRAWLTIIGVVLTQYTATFGREDRWPPQGLTAFWQERNLIRMVCRQGATQIAIGVAVRFLAGAAVVRAARATLFEVTPNDPVVFGIVAGVLAAAAFVACIIPAVSAARGDPLVALRPD